MTGWIRPHIATAGLKLALEDGGYSMPVVLTPPQDGIDIDENEVGEPLMGQVIYDYTAQEPESGDTLLVIETRVTLRRTALRIVPQPGEIWGVRIPTNPADPETLTQYIINTDETLTAGQTLGFITLIIKALDQI